VDRQHTCTVRRYKCLAGALAVKMTAVPKIAREHVVIKEKER
jgi:hypothetical protein